MFFGHLLHNTVNICPVDLRLDRSCSSFDQNGTNVRIDGKLGYPSMLIPDHDNFIFLRKRLRAPISSKGRGLERPGFIVNIKFLTSALNPGLGLLLSPRQSRTSPSRRSCKPLAHLRGTNWDYSKHQCIIQNQTATCF